MRRSKIITALMMCGALTIGGCTFGGQNSGPINSKKNDSAEVEQKKDNEDKDEECPTDLPLDVWPSIDISDNTDNNSGDGDNEYDYYYDYTYPDYSEEYRDAEIATDLDFTFSNGVLTVTGHGAIPGFEKGAHGRPWADYQYDTTEVHIEDGITRIGDRAFQAFDALEKVYIADSVESIGVWAFQNCYYLYYVEMPDDIILEEGVFRTTEVESSILAKESSFYKESPFYRNLLNVELTGDLRSDMIAIAKSQLGYHEGNRDEDICGLNAAGDNDYSEYGRYLDSLERPWCSEFASWCVRMTGLPLDRCNSSKGANAVTFCDCTSARQYEWKDTVYGGGSYVPRMGDILIWTWDIDNYAPDESLGHTSILTGAEDVDSDTVRFNVIEGNTDDSVKEGYYDLVVSNGHFPEEDGMLAYIVSPDFESQNYSNTIYFDANGGSVDKTSKTVYDNGVYGPLPEPERSGYTFAGWYTEAEGGQRINMYSEVLYDCGDTFYAHWE